MAFADVAKFLRAVLNDEFEFKLTGKAPHESLQITGPADSQLALDLFLFALDGRGRETGNKHNESGPADEPRPEVQGIPVSRVLYRLPADRCTTLKTFLSEQFPDEVDVRTKGETLQITASPDVQRAIGELIRLMQKKGRSQADVTVQPPASEEPNNPRSPAAPLDDRDQS